MHTNDKRTLISLREERRKSGAGNLTARDTEQALDHSDDQTDPK